MRIAQIAPLYEAVPPRGYGGTERVVSWLTEELVRQGHDVTLFASSDSRTSATLIDGMPPALRLSGVRDGISAHILMIEKLLQRAHEFDVIHSHVDYLPFSLFRHFQLPTVTTLHGRLDMTELIAVFDEFHDLPLVSISKAQRAPLPLVSWEATVHHGLPENLYNHCDNPDDYLLFLGRICPEKRVDRAIEIASRLGMRLIVAAKVDPADVQYYEAMKHLLTSPGVEYIGEVTDEQKNDLIGRAYALLFPIDWPEPFGLVMIEALACGTPIVAFKCGSVPEVIDEGRTGFIVGSVEEAVDAVKRLDKIDRRHCREVFEKRFSAATMSAQYVKVYERIAQRSSLRKVLYFPRKLSKPVNQRRILDDSGVPAAI